MIIQAPIAIVVDDIFRYLADDCQYSHIGELKFKNRRTIIGDPLQIFFSETDFFAKLTTQYVRS